MNEPTHRPKILILEDDIDLATQWQDAFAQHDADAVLATSRPEVEYLCQNMQFDALVVDIFIRDLDGALTGDGGLTAISYLRLPQHANPRPWGITVPIVAVTGSSRIAGFDAIEYAIDLGATTGLRKPIEPEELVSHVFGLIESCSVDLTDS